jgi:tetratricopeptide (TPR) repeat protein
MFRLLRRFAFSRERSPRERALSALRRRDFAAAEAGLTALLAGEADALERAFLCNKRGVARVGLRRSGDARADFEAALSSVAAYAPALTNLGNLCLEAGDVAAATAMYEAALRADPDYAVACLNLGVAYKRSGRIDEGVRLLRRAQQLERPKFVRRFRL